jgi:hypothetical protein
MTSKLSAMVIPNLVRGRAKYAQTVEVIKPSAVERAESRQWVESGR